MRAVLPYVVTLLLGVVVRGYAQSHSIQFAPIVLTLHKSVDEIDLLPFLYHLEGQQQRAFTEVVNELKVNHAHTFIFSVKNATADTLQQVAWLKPDFIQAQHVTLYRASNETTNLLWQNHWPLTIAPGETITVIFTLRELDRLNTEKVAFALVSAEYHNRYTQYIQKTQSFFLGLLTFLGLFNLIIYFVTGWKVYIRYTLYIAAALLYFLFYYGFLQEAFLPVKQASVNIISTWYALVYILYFYFLNEFGQYRIYSPWAYKLLNVGIINKCIQVVYETILNPLGVEFIYASWYKNTILTGEIILMVFIIFYILKNKNIRGKIVVAASLMLIIGAILGQLDFSPAVRGTFIQLGITAELLTFSVGLGYFTREFYQGQQQAQAQLIEQLQKNEQLQQFMREELEYTVKQRTAELEARNKENETLLAEVHHRVKNNLQIISSLINLKSGKENSSTDEILKQLNGRIFSMGLLHEKLYKNENLRSVRLDLYLNELIDYLLTSFQNAEKPIYITQELEEITVNADEALTCGLIYNEIFTNSMKHAFTHNQINRQVSVALKKVEDIIQFSIADNGDNAKKKIPELAMDSFGLRFVNQLVYSKLKGSWEMVTGSGLRTTISYTPARSGNMNINTIIT